jgi:hypothetical protein
MYYAGKVGSHDFDGIMMTINAVEEEAQGQAPPSPHGNIDFSFLSCGTRKPTSSSKPI